MTPTPEAPAPPDFRRLSGVTTVNESDIGGDGLARWRRTVPDIEDVRIDSSEDGEEQPALWLAPEGDEERPLLLVLHSWSTGYRQNLGIPYARWAERENWAFIHPGFRGINDDPQATGSDLAAQDTLDAIDYAVEQGGVDAEQVYVLGFSGGGMSALLMAGRHPERFAGVVAWVPIRDLNRWYVHWRRGRTGCLRLSCRRSGNGACLRIIGDPSIPPPSSGEGIRTSCSPDSPTTPSSCSSRAGTTWSTTPGSGGSKCVAAGTPVRRPVSP